MHYLSFFYNFLLFFCQFGYSSYPCSRQGYLIWVPKFTQTTLIHWLYFRVTALPTTERNADDKKSNTLWSTMHSRAASERPRNAAAQSRWKSPPHQVVGVGRADVVCRKGPAPWAMHFASARELQTPVERAMLFLRNIIFFRYFQHELPHIVHELMANYMVIFCKNKSIHSIINSKTF